VAGPRLLVELENSDAEEYEDRRQATLTVLLDPSWRQPKAHSPRRGAKFLWQKYKQYDGRVAEEGVMHTNPRQLTVKPSTCATNIVKVA
jgi:hypothetical protein